MEGIFISSRWDWFIILFFQYALLHNFRDLLRRKTAKKGKLFEIYSDLHQRKCWFLK
jgi:hypothetical protein